MADRPVRVCKRPKVGETVATRVGDAVITRVLGNGEGLTVSTPRHGTGRIYRARDGHWTVYLDVPRAPRASSAVQSRRNRETGTTVIVFDLDAPGAPLDRDDGFGNTCEWRWMTLCDDHGRLCTHPTRELAVSHASLPSGWCGVCAGTEPPDEN